MNSLKEAENLYIEHCILLTSLMKSAQEITEEIFFPLNLALLTYFDSKDQYLCGRNFKLLLKVWFILFYMRKYAKKVVQ